MTSDTSATVKLRWEANVTLTYEADVPVDQLPEQLIEEDGDEWSVRDGQFEQRVVLDFFESLDGAGAAAEIDSPKLQNVYILDEEPVAPIMVAAPPVPAVTDTTYIAEFGEVGDSDFWACENTGEHVPGAEHLWENCPTYNGQGD